MKPISLDTNAIIDFCYRNYPQHIFPSVWSHLQASLSASMIGFYECSAVNLEVKQLIEMYEYDEAIYENFLQTFKVKKINADQFAEQTMAMKRNLLGYPATKNSAHVTNDNYADADIVSLALYLKDDCMVLSSEQINPNFNPMGGTGSRNTLKVPNLCDIFNVSSGTWKNLFEHIGMNI